MPQNYASFTMYNRDLESFWVLNDVAYAEWVRTVNTLGSAQIEIPAKGIDFRQVLAVRAMTIDTHYDRGTPNLDTIWFATTIREVPMNDGRTSHYRIEFEDALSLLDNRIVPYKADFPEGSEPRTRINTVATAALGQIYDVSLGTLAGPNRVLDPIITTKAAIAAVAPVIGKEIPWKRALTAMQEVAKSSRDQGTPLFFDLIARNVGGSIRLTFATFTGQRGADKRNLIISSDHPDFVLDDFSYYVKYPNVGYVGGSGRGQSRPVVVREAPNINSIERYEIFRSSLSTDRNLLEDEAAALVNNQRGRVSLAGRLLGELGTNYDFGDLVLMQHRNFAVTAEIASIAYTYSDKVLTRDVAAKSVDEELSETIEL